MSSNLDHVLLEYQMNDLSSEFSRLKGKTYLDHAGATLYAESQIQNVAKDLMCNIYSNPHTSKHTLDCIDQIRFQVLNHFNTDSNEYSVIFCSGATAALKLVAESFVFDSNENGHQDLNNKYKNLTKGCFSYLQDNHTSVLGMREIFTSKLSEVICVPHADLIKTMSETEKDNRNGNSSIDTVEFLERGLFVYPAQCNFSGYKYPLKWIQKINNGALNVFTQEHCGKTFSEWATLLDAAAFVSTNSLDLTVFKPDFVCISFYKIFGYPTGLGALLVKNSSAHMLNGKTYYGGGTVQISLSGENFHVKRKMLQDRFEDGTIPFLSIMALKHGFDTLKTLIPVNINEKVMDKISLHTFNLAKYFRERLNSIRHYNGTPIAFIYSDTEYRDIHRQGGIVNFNLLRSNGDYIGYAEVTHMAELFDIFIRSGCFCNPGACQRFLKLSNQDLLSHFKSGHVCGDNNDLINGVPTGSLRVSFGYMSTRNDVESVINMITKCFLDNDSLKNLPNEITKFKLDPETKTKENVFKAKGILKEIHIYPVKSCAAFKVLKNWEIGLKGLKYDREWMIVSENGVALTQKHDTRMCMIQPRINLDKRVLELSFPGIEDLAIPFLEKRLTKTLSFCRSKVCGDKIEGYDCGDEASQWLLNVLGIPGLRLIKQSDSETRVFKDKSEKSIQITPISLSNQAQYLAINLASVRWLASKVETREFDDRIDNLTARFRGNLIIDTNEAFEEFNWKNVHIGNTNFKMVGACTRCQMVCIDQENGEKTVEPLRTISKQFEGKINFGSYFLHEISDISEKKIIGCGDIVYAK